MIQKHDKYFMNIARQVADGSKCLRAIYGSVIIDTNKQIISTGYNGKPKGSICDSICFRENLPPNADKENCCIHSEKNAIMFSDPLRRQGGTIYVSGICCKDCFLEIMQSGVRRLVYLDQPEPLKGHKGGSNEEYHARYGVPLEVVKFDYDIWESLFNTN